MNKYTPSLFLSPAAKEPVLMLVGAGFERNHPMMKIASMNMATQTSDINRPNAMIYKIFFFFYPICALINF